MIVSEIQTEAILRLGPGARVTAANILNSVDEGNKRIYSKLVQVHERLFYGTTSFNAVSGTSEYTTSLGVPTDIKKILKVETRYADQDKRVHATKIDLSNVNQMDKISTTYKSSAQPGYYWFGNGSNTKIGFIPTHDEAGENYNKIWYLKKPTDLTTGSQTPIVPDDAHYLIVQFTVANAQLMEDEDANTYLAFLKQWNRDVDEWLESEYPGDSEPHFTQDADGEEELL